LSQARGAGIAAASVGTQVLFAGGWNSNANSESDRVDIFDAATRVWSTASLSRAQSVSVATTVGNSVIFAVSFGGSGNTWAYADKFDASNGNWSIVSLSQFNFMSSQPVIFSGAATSGNLAVFFPSSPVINRLIIYNAAQGTWGISSEGLPFGWKAAIATVNNQIYVSDGEGVWKIEF
jgi:hypothetical protein